MALPDEHPGVVDGLGKTELVDASLQATLQEVLDLQGKDVIELHARLVEDTDTDETADKGVTLEKALGVLLVKGQERTGTSQILRPLCARQRIISKGAVLTEQHDGSWRG